MSKLTKDEIRANRLKWLEALESGEYQQTHGHGLRDKGGGYCCLGVACEVMGGGEWDGEDYSVGDGYIDCEATANDGAPSVLDWMRMSDSARWKCVQWNDGDAGDGVEEHTFLQIAAKMRGRWRLPREQA